MGREMTMTTRQIRRGTDTLSMLHLPEHGDIVKDRGTDWTIKMEGGFMLRSGGECHPDFKIGPMSALCFCQWINCAL